MAESGVVNSLMATSSPTILNNPTLTNEEIDYPFELSEPSATAHILSYNEPCTQTFSITEISQVRSLALEHHVKVVFKGVFNTCKKKTKMRTDTIKGASIYAKTPAQKTALDSLSERWSELESMFNVVNPQPENVMNRETFNQLKEAEQTDLSNLTGEGFKGLKSVINEFYTACEKLLTETERYFDEKEQILRFDSTYNNPEVRNLLDKIPYIVFTAAEVKALNMQETGDFTNTTVAGLTNKSIGIIANEPKNDHYIGLGQHNVAARNDALAWSKAKGEEIPANPDPRTIPKYAIRLTIATWGWLAERKICPYLGDMALDCLEVKKMIFASYNAGVEHILYAVKRLHGNKDKNIT